MKPGGFNCRVCMLDPVLKLRTDLQLAALRKMGTDKLGPEDLAVICGVSTDRIEHILQLDVWPLEICLFVTKKLGLQIKVVSEEI